MVISCTRSCDSTNLPDVFFCLPREGMTLPRRGRAIARSDAAELRSTEPNGMNTISQQTRDKRTRAEVLRERSKHMLRVAELDAELADLESVTTMGDRYSSTCLPPDCPSRRTFAAICRSGRVAGAVLEGHTWSCPREAWHTTRARKRPLRCVPQPVQMVLASRSSGPLREGRIGAP